MSWSKQVRMELIVTSFYLKHVSIKRVDLDNITTFTPELRLRLKILVPPEAATMVRKGSTQEKPCILQGFFIGCQWVRVVKIFLLKFHFKLTL